MARYNEGPTGNFSGKLGPVVGARWKEIAYMRSKPVKSKKRPTRAQLDHRAKFAAVAKFIHRMNNILMFAFPATGTRTGPNQAFADVYSKALIGTYPNYALDYAKICISKGELLNAENLNASATGNGLLTFNWTDNSNGNMANTNDRSILVAWCPELHHCISAMPGPTRSACTGFLNLVNYQGKIFHSWIAFISADGKTVSTSVYTGEFIII